MKYKIQLSMYGTVAERADIIIEAKSKDEANETAIKMCENGEVEFSNDQESASGWEYQTEEIVEVK